jgi:hypothetical protein
MVSSLTSMALTNATAPCTQTMTTGLEDPKLQILLSNVTKGPNWSRPRQQLAPRRAKVTKRVAEKCCVDN